MLVGRATLRRTGETAMFALGIVCSRSDGDMIIADDTADVEICRPILGPGEHGPTSPACC